MTPLFSPRTIVPLWLLAAVLVLAMSLVRPGVAAAQGIEADIAALAAGGFNDKAAAVERLAVTGDPRVVPALEALLDGGLYTRKSDGKVVIGEARGKVVVLSDPLTLTEVEQAPKRSVKKIRINNMLRGAVRAALGGLTLLGPDPAGRQEAADAVFKGRTAEMAPLLETALARETDETVRERMLRALAAVQVTTSNDTDTRIAALGVLADAGDQDVRALVAGLLVTGADGSPAEPDAVVREAAAKTLERIEDRLAWLGFVTNVFQGISLGSVLLLAAVGLAITFGVMGVINMAHGEMVMLGAYTTFVVQEGFRAVAPELFDYSLLVAVPAAFLVAGLFGIAIERGIIRFLYGRPLETLLATWGLSLILQQLVRTVFGPTNREVGNPSWMSGAIEITGGLSLTYNRIWIIVFSLMVLAMLLLLMRKTSLGLRMRAVTQNRQMARRHRRTHLRRRHPRPHRPQRT